MSRSLEDRLKIVLNAATTDADAYGRWKRLESLTSISAARWKNVNSGTQRPAPDMIEALARLMPQYAFWLSTGLTDPKYGHVAPESEGFPDRGEEQPATTRYFKECVSARDAAYAALDAWMQEKFGIDDPIEAEMSKADRLLRAMPKLTNEENGTLGQAMARVRTSEEIRRAEIDMHNDMPEMDYDETETVLRSIKRAMSKLAERASAHTMGEEFESVQRKIAHIDEMIVRHRRASATIGQKNDDRDTAK